MKSQSQSRSQPQPDDAPAETEDVAQVSSDLTLEFNPENFEDQPFARNGGGVGKLQNLTNDWNQLSRAFKKQAFGLVAEVARTIVDVVEEDDVQEVILLSVLS